MGAVRLARKIAVAVVGFGLLIIGLAMLALPGPGIAVLIAALLVLASEFQWAERYAERLKRHVERLMQAARRKKP